jgi:putative RecB family exonuclease
MTDTSTSAPLPATSETDATPIPAPAVGGAGDATKLPTYISPSRLADFAQCPAQFWFKSIARIPTASTAAQLIGTLTHAAIEHVFTLPVGTRTPEEAVAAVDSAWEELKDRSSYANLAADTATMTEILSKAREHAANWFLVEDPNRFDPAGVELKLYGDVDGVPLLGILDRLDRYERTSDDIRWFISDIKTGKVPAENDRFLSEKFFGMNVYAVLVHELFGVVPHTLRLVYTAGASRYSVRRSPVTEKSIAATRKKIVSLWKGINSCATSETWPCRTSRLCDWCDFKGICPAFDMPDGSKLPD